MPDSQALRLNSIYSKNESFDIDCNYLEIEKIDNDQIIKKNILKKMMFAKISINVKERYLVDKIYPGCFEIAKIRKEIIHCIFTSVVRWNIIMIKILCY